MAIKPISIRTLEDRFVCGCAEERDCDDGPTRTQAPPPASFRQRRDVREANAATQPGGLRRSDG